MGKTILILFLTFSYTTILGQDKATSAFYEGKRQLKAQQFEGAVKSFDKAIKHFELPEGQKMSHIYKGLALNGLGDYKKAVACFDKAIEIDPADGNSYVDRGLSFSRLGDVESAMADFKHAVEMEGDKAQPVKGHFHLGWIYSVQGNHEQAIQHFDALLLLSPEDAEAYFLRGVAKGNLLDHAGAVADYDLAIKYYPEYRDAYANRGVAKINALPMEEKFGREVNCLEDPCKDLKRAQEMGDQTVGDLIHVHCRDCE